MKYWCFLTLVSLSISYALSGQSDYIDNPSFDGEPGRGSIPAGWTVCNAESTPDTQPLDVLLQPTDGESYAGLIMSGQDNPGKNEDLATALNLPLYRDSAYLLSVDLAYVPDYREGETIFDKVPQLLIKGGSQRCVTAEVFVVSEPINNSGWVRYCFVITPEVNTTFLAFEIFVPQFQPSYLVMDDITIESFSVKGPQNVCAGSQNQIYSLPQADCATAVNAVYSGEGVLLSIAGNSIEMDFGESATDGNLVISYMNNNSEPESIEFPINVDAGLPVSGIISGSEMVCQGQMLEYYFTDASNTTIYNWSYSGTGAEINVIQNGATINFADKATSGILNLVPENGCGTGSEMTLGINIVPLPASPGIISGKDVVCPGETHIYHIPGISYADDYVWNYTGNGVTLNDGTLDVRLSFSENASGGYLTVSGSNACGEGERSANFIIFMNDSPGQAGTIEGANTVCNEEKIVFQTPAISHATEYVWHYTGSGSQIVGNSNQVEINFQPGATDGMLTVTGKNNCGTGTSSPMHEIRVGAVPETPGEISGMAELCSEEGGVFTIQPVTGAVSYIWNYDGQGALISADGTTAKVKFEEQVAQGSLTVQSKNDCGSSAPSPPISIKAASCLFFVPNAFTPNNDGTNDAFVIPDLENTVTLFVFDRWGKLVFESEAYNNDWDGRDLKGKSLPSDTYWYVLSVAGLSKEIKGHVFLKR